MVDLPSFFNRPDFFGKILPGYVTVILYIALFKSNILLTKDNANNSSTSLLPDIFVAIVFLVAGPAVGFTLYLFHRYLYTVRYGLARDQGKKQNRFQFVQNYTKVKIKCSDTERSELDNTESEYDFSVSTAIGLLIIGTYYLLYKMDNIYENLEIKVAVLALAIFLLVGVRFHNEESYSPSL